MATLIVPGREPDEDEEWPSFGHLLADFIEANGIYGPGPLQGQPYVVDDEFYALLIRACQVYPQGHELAGVRRFERVCWSVRKGWAKTEKEALVALTQLHPDGPAVCDGFDAYGVPVARPVAAPYIPMLAYAKEQVEELAFGALSYICLESADASCFDVSKERILRLDHWGRADGKAAPLAQSPNARDGARTTLNCFDEPHRLFQQRHLDAHETMNANLPKRQMDQPWSLYVGTAGEPGEGSIAEQIHNEAKAIDRGEVTDPKLFYFYRYAGDGVTPDRPNGYDLDQMEDRIEAVREATGPIGEWGRGQFRRIASQWDRPAADKQYLARVWLNRWVNSEARAFDIDAWRAHTVDDPIPDGALITVGFDGSRRWDATALVITEVATGKQSLFAVWERPEFAPDDWEVRREWVDAAVDEVHRRFDVWRGFADPPYWEEAVNTWCGRYDVWRKFYTNLHTKMGPLVAAYRAAIEAGEVKPVDGPNAVTFARHIANAGRHKLRMQDDLGDPLYALEKLAPGRKFDAAMAALLSWAARLEALEKGATSANEGWFVPGRVEPSAAVTRGAPVRGRWQRA